MSEKSKKRWFALDLDGDMKYVGEFTSFDEADASLGSYIWLVSEESARDWLTQLSQLLDASSYTVIGHYPDTGQVFCDHVHANSGLHAFAVTVRERGDEPEFSVAIRGRLREGDALTFPGEGLVDGATIADQPEVFGESRQPEHSSG